MSRKPRVFIGSSVEGLPVADAINLNLDHEAEVTLWRTGAFDLASTALDSLVARSQSVDFATFVFSPDDVSIIRDQRHAVVRDNVLFELGLFIGALGKERCFIVKPRNVDLHFPTDLLGITPADYEPARSDDDVSAAVNHACVLIKRQIGKLGLLRSSGSSQQLRPISATADTKIWPEDYELLGALARTATRYSTALSLQAVEGARPRSAGANGLRNLDISAIRLERRGLIERRIEQDQDGYEFFAYSITEQGIEELLSLHDRRQIAMENERTQRQSFADDVPL